MKEKTNPDANLSSDVQVIRNILLGEHLQRFQNQLDALEKELSALKKANQGLWKELKEENEQRYQQLTVRLEQMNDEQREASNALHKDFDAQIKEMSKRLLSHEEQQGGLITSLAEALRKHDNTPGG